MVPLPARLVVSPSGCEVKPTEAMTEDWRIVPINCEDVAGSVTTLEAASVKIVGIW